MNFVIIVVVARSFSLSLLPSLSLSRELPLQNVLQGFACVRLIYFAPGLIVLVRALSCENKIENQVFSRN